MSTEYTLADVAKHNTADDAWIAISGTVYNITKFARMHPGGKKIILEYAGRDATEAFFEMHRAEVLLKYQRLAVGTIKGFDEDDAPDLSLIEGGMSEVPYGEPSFFQGWRSPFWKEEHIEFRSQVRKFVFSNFREAAIRGAASGKSPTIKDYQLCGKAGLLALRLGPGRHLHGKTIFGVKGEDITYWHEMIAHEEWNHLGCPGWVDGLATGMVIGLPPVMHFAKKHVADRVIPKVLAGDERICLAISEPFAGSDVANIKCTAVKSADGSHYIVNGVKKWITNGTFCDWFVTAARTGGPGFGGISLFLIPRSEGLDTKLIKTSYSSAAGTAYITYEDVKVPAEYLLGQENQGFKCIMHNFNHERWFICAAVAFGSRKITQQCFQWAMQRKAFGKRLIDQPVIRQKLAKMVAQNEACTNWLENITYQMCEMSYEEQNMRLAGAISMLKMQTTDTAYFVSDEACQIFGGRAITRGGMGQYIERFQRAIKFGAILGGSTEVMADLGVRMAMKFFPGNAKL